jgi:hypothetical protein
MRYMTFGGELKKSDGTWVILVVAALSGCSPCSNEIIARKTSPDGTLDAVAFERGCSFGGQLVTNVSVIEAGSELPNTAGNVLQMRRPSDAAYKLRVDMTWSTSDSLRVSPDPRATYRWAVSTWGELSIIYDNDNLGTE